MSLLLSLYVPHAPSLWLIRREDGWTAEAVSPTYILLQSASHHYSLVLHFCIVKWFHVAHYITTPLWNDACMQQHDWYTKHKTFITEAVWILQTCNTVPLWKSCCILKWNHSSLASFLLSTRTDKVRWHIRSHNTAQPCFSIWFKPYGMLVLCHVCVQKFMFQSLRLASQSTFLFDSIWHVSVCGF